MDEVRMLDIERLLKKAQKVPMKYCGPFASDYIPVIAELRDKNLTWQEITDFFRENGVELSYGSLYSVWHKHERRLRRLRSQAADLVEELEEAGEWENDEQTRSRTL